MSNFSKSIILGIMLSLGIITGTKESSEEKVHEAVSLEKKVDKKIEILKDTRIPFDIEMEEIFREMIMEQRMKDSGAVEYISPENIRRPRRKSTLYVLIHNSEGYSPYIHDMVRDGSAHFIIDFNGKIYRTLDLGVEGFHAGRSMWNGLDSLDKYTVGIEFIGFHNWLLTPAQFKSGKMLIGMLKEIYPYLCDEDYLTHANVAYKILEDGKMYRGRKKDGRLLANPKYREYLGLGPAVSVDPDVAAGRILPFIENDWYLYAWKKD